MKRKSHTKKTQGKGTLRILSFSKTQLLLVVFITAAIGGVYAVYQSFAYTDSKGRLWGTYGIQVRQMHSTALVSGATVGVQGYYDDGSSAGETCNDNHDVSNMSAGYRYRQSDVSGYSYFTCITRNASGQRISYRLASLSRADYAATTDGPSSSPSVCSFTACINIGSTVLNPSSSSTSVYATYMYARPGVPAVTGADRAQTSLTLRWNPVAGAVFYQTYLNGQVYGTTSNNYQTISGVPSSVGLKCNTAYTLGVQSIAGGLTSGVAAQSFTTAACSVVTAPGSSTQTVQPAASTPAGKPINTSTSSKTVARSQPASANNSSDTTPPSAPGSLTATEGAGGTIVLSWDASTDNKAVTGYVVERSTDGQNWTSLSDGVTTQTYSDSSAAFNTKYTYRVSAKDEVGNGSDYAVVDITTSAFEANALANQETTIESEDKNVSVKIPEGALPEDAACKVDSTQESTLPEDQSLVAGVYSFICKKKDGSTIDKYNKPLEFTVKATSADQAKLAFQDGDQWQDSGEQYNGDVQGYTFSTDQPKNFAILANSQKGTNWFLLIFGAFLLLLALFAALMWFIRRKQQRDLETGGYNLDYFDNYMQSADQQGEQTENPSAAQVALPPAAPPMPPSSNNEVYTPEVETQASAPVQYPAPEIKKMHDKSPAPSEVRSSEIPAPTVPGQSPQAQDDYANKQYPEQPYR